MSATSLPPDPSAPPVLGGLAASMAHELNNQLAILMGRAELLQDTLAPDSAAAEDLRVIREAAAHSHRAAQALVELVRPRAAPVAALALDDAVLAAAAMLAYTLRSGGVALVLALEPPSPVVRAPAPALQRLLLGLLFVAQRAARETPAPQVHLATGNDAGAVLRLVSAPGWVHQPELLAVLDWAALLQARVQREGDTTLALHWPAA